MLGEDLRVIGLHLPGKSAANFHGNAGTQVHHPSPFRTSFPELKMQKVAAIIVVYNPNLTTLIKLLSSAGSQAAYIYVVDNGNSDLQAWLNENSFSQVRYIFIGKNIGIGAAQNIGIREAMLTDASHILLLDHDSIPDRNMVGQLMEAGQELTDQGKKIAAVGPRYNLHGTKVQSYFVRFGRFTLHKIYCADPENIKSYIPVDFLISSGCLISLASLKDIGLLDESLFIDHVDTEWFLRAHSMGYTSFGVCNAIMNHNLGDYFITVWVGKNVTIPIRSPLRLYYIFRNSIVLCRKPYAPQSWIIIDAIRLLQMFVFFSFFVPPRMQFIRMMTRGIYDGILGKGGKLEN